MVGGLLLRQIFTLYTTPVIYLWFDRLGSRFGKRKPMQMDLALEGASGSEG